MLDRRQSARDKVIYRGVAEIAERGASQKLHHAQYFRQRRPSSNSPTTSIFPRNDYRLTHRAQGPLLHGQGRSGYATTSSALPSTPSRLRIARLGSR